MKKFVLALAIALMTFTSTADDEVIIMDKFINHEQMTRSEARMIFTARTRYWKNQERVVVFHYPSKFKIYNDFVKEVLRYNPTDFTRMLEQQMNSGLNNTVKFVRSEDEMVNAVAATVGSIGYVKAYFYLNNGSGHVKQIPIIAD